MANPNGLNPSFDGNVTAKGFATPYDSHLSKAVQTNGTTKVDVLGTTNGIRGTIVAVKIIARDDSNGTVDLAGSNGTICRITKGSIGSVRGSHILISGTHGTTFGPTGTMTVSMTPSSGECLVEVDFLVSNPGE